MRFREELGAKAQRKPSIRIEGRLSAALGEAERALCRLDGAALAAPTLDGFVRMRLREEALRTTCGEITPASWRSLLATDAKASGDKGGSGSPDLAAGYLRVLEQGPPRWKERPLSAALFAAMQAESGGTSSPPEPRGGSAPNDLSDVARELEACLRLAGELPPLVRIGLAYGRSGVAQPLSEANERFSRLLAACLLERFEATSLPGALLPSLLRRNPAECGNRLRAIREKGDWEGWLAYFLRETAAAGTESAQAIRNFVRLQEQDRATVAEKLGHNVGRGLRVLERLYREPILAAGDVRNITGTSYVAANQLVARFVELGILEEGTGYRRNRLFRHGRYLRIFSAALPAADERRQAGSRRAETLAKGSPTDAFPLPEDSGPEAAALPSIAPLEPPPTSSGREPIPDELL